MIENKYLHERLHKTAIRRSKEILANNNSVSKTKFLLTSFEYFIYQKKKTKACVFKQIQIREETDCVRDK